MTDPHRLGAARDEAFYASSFICRNLQVLALGVTALAMTCVALVWMGTVQNLLGRQYEAEIRAANTGTKFEIYKALIRLKDAANFVHSGAGGLVAAKLRQTTNTSEFIRSIGYIEPGSGRLVDLMQAREAQTPATRAAALDLQRRIEGHRGGMVVFNAADYPVLLGAPNHDTLLMAQAQPLGAPDEKIVFATFDFTDLCRHLLQPGQFAFVHRLRTIGRDIHFQCDRQPRNSFLVKLLNGPDQLQKVTITSDFDIEMASQRMRPMLDEFILVVVVVAVCVGFMGVAALLANRWQRHARQMLVEAVEKANSSAAAKDEFLANMSHEIRTPMNGVLGMAQLLSRTRLDGNQRRYVEQIESSGSALLAILNDVLDLAKIDQGKMAIDPVATNLPQLVQAILLLYTGNASERNVSLLLDISRAVPTWIMVDPARLRQILGNLVSNAVKFTKDGEVLVQVEVESARDQVPMLVVAVRDTGIGISQEQQSRLFERFAQAEIGTSRQFGGTGLGLSIVRQLVELMGGRIDLDSAIGEGATFTLRIPLVAAQGGGIAPQGRGVALIASSIFVREIVVRAMADANILLDVYHEFDDAVDAVAKGKAGPFSGVIIDEAHDAYAAWQGLLLLMENGAMREKAWTLLLADREMHPRYRHFDRVLTKPFISSELVRHVLGFIQRPRGEADASAPDGAPHPAIGDHHGTAAAPRYDGCQCLVVDDNAINRTVIGELLETFGFGVDYAGDGHKAIAAARAKAYDVIFMDCRMPHMDGFDAARELCAMMESGDMATVPIVALTANAMKSDRDACLEAGMKAFLSKPVRLPELIDTLAPLVRRRDGGARGEVAGLGAAITGSDDSHGRGRVAARFEHDMRMVANGGWAVQSGPAEGETPAGQTGAACITLVPSSGSGGAVADLAELPELLDRQTYGHLKKTMNSFGMLIGLYRNDTRDYLNRIADALAHGDFQAAVLPAHTIKGTSRTVGAMAMGELAADLETRLQNPDKTPASAFEKLVEQMKAVFALTLDEIGRQ